jgi:hypothetical protein
MQALSDSPAARFSPSLAWSPCNSSVLMFLFRRQPSRFVAAPLAASAVRSDGFWERLDHVCLVGLGEMLLLLRSTS